MPFTIVRNDITKMQVTAIVNAANTSLAMGGGVCGAIFRAAGADKLKPACDKLAPIKTGEAAVTPAFDLPCKFIIHAAGPVYDPAREDVCQKQLRSAYINSLFIALEQGCESIAFPLISSGIYGYPKDKALETARAAILDFLAEHDMNVYLAVFDNASFAKSRSLCENVRQYIDSHYVEENTLRRTLLCVEKAATDFAAALGNTKQGNAKRGTAKRGSAKKTFLAKECLSSVQQQDGLCQGQEEMPHFFRQNKGLNELIEQLDEPFSATLLRLIDAKGMNDVAVYKRANIDRKLFSKIRSAKGYMPGKRTVIALAIAMELSLEETADLLKRAGFALSKSQIFDVIIEYFILNGIYDIYEINEVLFQYDQPLLGA